MIRAAAAFLGSCALTLAVLAALFFRPVAWASSGFGADVLGLAELLPAAIFCNAGVYGFTPKVKVEHLWAARTGIASVIAAVILAFSNPFTLQTAYAASTRPTRATNCELQRGTGYGDAADCK